MECPEHSSINYDITFTLLLKDYDVFELVLSPEVYEAIKNE